MKKNLLRFLCFVLSFPSNILQAEVMRDRDEALLRDTFPQVSQRTFDISDMYDGRTFECAPDGNDCRLITSDQPYVVKEIESCEGDICRTKDSSLIIKGKKSDVIVSQKPQEVSDGSVSERDRTIVPQVTDEVKDDSKEFSDPTLNTYSDPIYEDHHQDINLIISDDFNDVLDDYRGADATYTTGVSPLPPPGGVAAGQRNNGAPPAAEYLPPPPPGGVAAGQRNNGAPPPPPPGVAPPPPPPPGVAPPPPPPPGVAGQRNNGAPPAAADLNVETGATGVAPPPQTNNIGGLLGELRGLFNTRTLRGVQNVEGETGVPPPPPPPGVATAGQTNNGADATAGQRNNGAPPPPPPGVAPPPEDLPPPPEDLPPPPPGVAPPPAAVAPPSQTNNIGGLLGELRTFDPKNLKHVEETRPAAEQTNNGADAIDASGVAAILARRLPVEPPDSDSESESGGDGDGESDNEWSDEEN
jgi:hypothetical protein